MTLTQVERAYYVRKLGGTQAPTRPLNDIKREYWAKVVGTGTANSPFNELQYRWLVKVVGTAGLTPAHYKSDLWKQMVISISGSPARTMNQNQIIFYSTAP